MTPRRFFIAAFLISMITGCGRHRAEEKPVVHPSNDPIAKGMDDSPDIKDIARNYRHLHLMTKSPVPVDLEIASRCVSSSPARFGPHANTFIRIFMNDLAAEAFCKSNEFPAGSVIVKEKQGSGYPVDASASQASSKTSNPSDKMNHGVGGMIKRPAGYDPLHGDWEYFYFDDLTSIERGKIASCIECHRDASASDHVFGSWAH